MTLPTEIVMLHGAPFNVGGLGQQSLNAVNDILSVGNNRVVTIGPGYSTLLLPLNAKALSAPTRSSVLPYRFTWLRWLSGRRQYLEDIHRGAWSAEHLASLKPSIVYGFTQVSLEAFSWAHTLGIPTVLESPNGHIRAFREVYIRETTRFNGFAFLGHPIPAMVNRVEEEYKLANLIRVSTNWARDSLIAGGVNAKKIVVVPQKPLFTRFHPAIKRNLSKGPLRVCFVGTLDLRKGFVYLLRAARLLGPKRIKVKFIGGTVDRFTKLLFQRESSGLNVEIYSGDPLPALHWSEVFVLPTLEDGSPFVVLEAMATGVPIIVTTECGNKDLVRQGENGWVVPAADYIALADALTNALANREQLFDIGKQARADWEILHQGSHSEKMRHLLSNI